MRAKRSNNCSYYNALCLLTFSLLREINLSTHGTLNDTAILDYAQIEVKSGFIGSKCTGHLLSSRNTIHQVRKAENCFGVEYLGISHIGSGN